MAYIRIRELGSGSFGKVYQVEDSNGNNFAQKVLDPNPGIAHAIANGHLSAAELQERFEREVRYQSKLVHPNIVRIVDFDLSADPPFFVMELAECTLHREIQTDKSLGGNVSNALFDILTGLEVMHELGFVHRDLKPQNVLKLRNADDSFRYALSDFGLMTATLSNTTTLTATGAKGGTENYAAPELLGNFKKATAASDIYSFGAILHDIYSSSPRIPYTELNLLGPLAKIVAKCTRTLPMRRYSTVASLRADLYDVLSTEVIVFQSNAEQEIVELLNANDELTDPEWDRVFSLLEQNDDKGQPNGTVFRAIRREHILQLSKDAPELIAALGHDFSMNARNTGFDYDYCDVLADKLTALFDVGDIALKASVLLSMLEMGTSHNRWFVERRFIRLAGVNLDDTVAKRVVADIEVLKFPFETRIGNWESSIKMSRDLLHPTLRALLK